MRFWIVSLFLSALGFTIGFTTAHLRWQNEFTAYTAQVAKEKLDSANEYGAQLSAVTSKYANELYRIESLASSRGVELERLRQSNARLQARIKASPQSPDAAALGRCSELLEAGAGLVSEGERLLRRNAAEHDALIGLLEGHATIFTRSKDSPKLSTDSQKRP